MLKLNNLCVRLICVTLLLTTIGFSYFQSAISKADESDKVKKWYVYGLMYQDSFDDFQKELLAYGVQLVSKGCIIGGDEYRKDVLNNQRVYDSSPAELKLLLGEPHFRV